jgi:hypothetical protein
VTDFTIYRKKLNQIIHLAKQNPVDAVWICLGFLLPLIISLWELSIGSFPFWSDPARDFLQAWNNHTKLSLLGPISGIPGIFYGPYWIWALSLVLRVSRDPRFAVFVLFFLPYFVAIPYMLSKFREIFSIRILTMLWILFITADLSYATHPWHPHLALPLFLWLIYRLVLFDPKKNLTKILFSLFGSGLISGILFTIHISFGLGICAASVLYILVRSQENHKKISFTISSRLLIAVSRITPFIAGFFVALTPIVLFEIRHQFLQTKALYKTLTDAIFFNSSVVGQIGMSTMEIFRNFWMVQPEHVLHIIWPNVIYIVYAIVIAEMVYTWRTKRTPLTIYAKNLLLFIILCFGTLGFLFLSSKNPIWGYHFLGTEWLYIFSIGLLAFSFPIINKTLVAWSTILILMFIPQLFSSFQSDHSRLSTEGTKKSIVESLFKKSSGITFGYAVYTPSIYSYDYDYLFRWLGTDTYHNLPEQNAKTMFILIPEDTNEAIAEDFIHAKTPQKNYKTTESWITSDKTIILKRSKIL